MSKCFPSCQGQGLGREGLVSHTEVGTLQQGKSWGYAGEEVNPFPACLLLERWLPSVLVLRAPGPAGPRPQQGGGRNVL